MGHRLHAQKIHVIEYGSTEAFNWAVEEIDNIITDLCPSHWSDDMEHGNPTNYEIDKEEFANMISTLEDMDDEYFEDTYLYVYSELTREYVIETFKSFLKESENNNSHWVFLTWF